MTTPSAEQTTEAPADALRIPAPRRKRRDLERLLIDTGRTIIQEEGLGTGIEHLTFKRVFDRLQSEHGVKVTNASVIGRIWENQDDFQRAILRTLAASGDEDLTETLAMLDLVIEGSDRTTPESRLLALSEICRHASAIELDAMLASREWKNWVAMWGLHGSQDSQQADAEVGTLLADSYAHWTEMLKVVYANVLSRLGFEVSPGYTIDNLVAAIAAMTEGSALRDRLEPQVTRQIMTKASPDGIEREWTLLGLGNWSIVQMMCRPIEGFQP